MNRFGVLILSVFCVFTWNVKGDKKCPNFSGTFTGMDIKKKEFVSKIEQKGCESITIDDERYGKRIVYLMDGKVVENPLFDKDAKNATHIRNYFACDSSRNCIRKRKKFLPRQRR